MENKLLCTALNIAPDVTLYHTGPALDHGPLPSLFYFALSGPDSLCLDPYNQPIRFLQGKMVRTFSLTLPAHEDGLSPTQALRTWAEDYAKGQKPLEEFLEKAMLAFDFVLKERLADPMRIAAAGLSRGGFLAAHFAAREPRLRALLAFAPITHLHASKDFHALSEEPRIQRLSLPHLAHALCDRPVRLYIGNRDELVGTRLCFEFAMALVEKAHEKKEKIARTELILTPSIGRLGHGTSPEVFQQGASWIAEQLHL